MLPTRGIAQSSRRFEALRALSFPLIMRGFEAQTAEQAFRHRLLASLALFLSFSPRLVGWRRQGADAQMAAGRPAARMHRGRGALRSPTRAGFKRQAGADCCSVVRIARRDHALGLPVGWQVEDRGHRVGTEQGGCDAAGVEAGAMRGEQGILSGHGHALKRHEIPRPVKSRNCLPQAPAIIPPRLWCRCPNLPDFVTVKGDLLVFWRPRRELDERLRG